ncbi:phytanoyl-CoA dioxygenase family protein [Nocardia sp. NPDC050710]|uniref:phytanoyl-CoA dioxygenase family protein n=1 Tax=Nocardia sp. NPDC050710 TaxID=3157220 RepID=UPI0033F866EF
MQLNDELLAQYDRDGFLIADFRLDSDEIARLRAAFEIDCRTSAGPHRIADERAGLVRALYAPHQRLPEYRALTEDPRILTRVRRLLRTDDIYVYQCKINSKSPVAGEKWSWHQDFAAWRIADNLPRPQLTNVAVFLDDMTEFNGPLVFIPGSHKNGTIDVAHKTSERSAQHLDPDDIAVDTPTLAELVAESGMYAPKGPAGTILFFSPEIVHGSANNISPFPRRLLIITYNEVTNLPRWSGTGRPEYLVGRPARHPQLDLS